MTTRKIEIASAAVVMVVILRLSLGCHFLYEGLWKIHHAAEFSAAPFLLQAKGPTAPLFYAMMPDLDGRTRLATGQSDKGKPVIAGDAYSSAWTDLQKRVVRRYKLAPEQIAKTDGILAEYKGILARYLAEHLDDIQAYFKSLEILKDEQARADSGAEFQQQRLWDQQQKLRKEVGVWLADLDLLGTNYQNALWNVMDDDQQARGWLTDSRNPLDWSRIEQINFMVTYSLTAIGLCLMLGLCTRLASLGGAGFLLFVVLTQFPWPTVYPPAPAPVGHSLWVNKDWIEMMTLLLMATLPAGRWGGLDFFLYHWIGRPLAACCAKNKGKTT